MAFRKLNQGPERGLGSASKMNGSVALLVLLMLSWGCGDDPTGPENGTISVTTQTTAASPGDKDPNGYELLVDGNLVTVMGTDDTHSVSASGGTHDVELVDIALNCSLTGASKRKVSVDGGQSPVLYTVQCDELPKGNLLVTAETAGDDPDPDGYDVKVDAMSRGQVGPDGSLLVEDLVALTSHNVLLDGVADNCTVQDNPRSVNVTDGGETPVVFSVTCEALPRGDLRIVTHSFGFAPDPDGYVVTVDPGGNPQGIGANESADFLDLLEGTYSVELSGLADNCGDPRGETRTVSITQGVSVVDTFFVGCPGVPRLAISARLPGGGTNIVYSTTPDGAPDDTLRVDAGARGARWSPDRRRLVFVPGATTDVEASRIEVMNADGSHRAVVFSSAPGVDVPDWSPASDTIVFARKCSGCELPQDKRNSDLLKVHVDGGSTVPTNIIGWEPRFSPDGTRIAYIGPDRELWVADSDGSNPSKLTSSGITISTPAWHPDGTQISYQKQFDDNTGDTRLYVIDVDGTNETELTVGFNDKAPAYSGDGTEIVFMTKVSGGFDIWIMGADGSNRQPIWDAPTDWLLSTPDWAWE